MPTPLELVIMLREASKVERSHTMPHHGSYTIGQHSYDMLTLAYVLVPADELTKNLMLGITFHDTAERWTGDMPNPAKYQDGEFARRLEQLETRIARKLGFHIQLTPQETKWLVVLDKLELLLWAHEQIAMGNRSAAAVIGNLASWFMHNKVPEHVAEFIRTYEWTRTPDTLQ